MTKFSFNNFNNNNNRNSNQQDSMAYTPRSRGANAFQPRMVDPIQDARKISYYSDLCRDKRIQPQDITKWAVRDLQQEIERLVKLPYPASENQLTKIAQLKMEINELKGERKKFKDSFLATLTGGKDGTASKLIQSLYEQIKSLEHLARPTDDQLQTLVSWYYCVDIPFHEYDINFKVEVTDEPVNEYTRTVGVWSYTPMVNKVNGKLESYSTGNTEYYVEETVRQSAWRMMTPDEFAMECKSKMMKTDAHAFINKYRGVFYEWQQSRCTQEQRNTIREIENELARIGTPKSREVAVDFDGEEFDYSEYSSRDRRTVYEEAYVPLTEEQLILMDVSEASDWIDRLRWERDNVHLFSSKEQEAYLDETEQAFYEKYGKYTETSYTDVDEEIMDAEDWSEAYLSHAGMPKEY